MTLANLGAYGLERMTDESVREFLASQQSGVLGLPAEDAPYLVPLSYGFDGENRLYFTYVATGASRKARLSDSAERAQFLVYRVDSPFAWESVLLTGTIQSVDRDRWAELEEVLDAAWRPDVFERASLDQSVAIYEFQVEERNGIKHNGLPPALRDDE